MSNEVSEINECPQDSNEKVTFKKTKRKNIRKRQLSEEDIDNDDELL